MNPDKSPKRIQTLFDEISLYYDKMNNFISLGLHYFVKISAVKMLKIKSGASILDICCGTGDFTKIIRKISPQSKIIGVDFSSKMLEIARKKQNKEVFIQADCTNLPFKDEEFDYITVGFGLRNIENRTKALNEACRVLKSNGKFLYLDFEGSNYNFAGKVFEFIVPIFIKIFDKNIDNYRYLIESKNSYPKTDILINEFKKSGFKILSSKTYVNGIIRAVISEK